MKSIAVGSCCWAFLRYLFKSSAAALMQNKNITLNNFYNLECVAHNNDVQGKSLITAYRCRINVNYDSSVTFLYPDIFFSGRTFNFLTLKEEATETTIYFIFFPQKIKPSSLKILLNDLWPWEKINRSIVANVNKRNENKNNFFFLEKMKLKRFDFFL